MSHSSRRFHSRFSDPAPVIPSPAPSGRVVVTADLRAREVHRLSHSPLGAIDLDLVRALGTLCRYLTVSQLRVLYGFDLSSGALGRRLGHLYRAQWVNRESQTGTHMRHPPQVYSLGELGADWLRWLGTPSRWPVREGWLGTVDPLQAHWLGIADIWVGLLRTRLRSMPMKVQDFKTELDIKYVTPHKLRGSFKPDGFFVLSDREQTLLVYFEFDRDTESLAMLEAKVHIARQFADSLQWPWSNLMVEYWVFGTRESRLDALVKGFV